jgi:hypothetical protein
MPIGDITPFYLCDHLVGDGRAATALQSIYAGRRPENASRWVDMKRKVETRLRGRICQGIYMGSCPVFLSQLTALTNVPPAVLGNS